MDFVRVLESLENLIFEVALWVIFVPKTLIKTVLRPNWIWGFASGELQKDKLKRYDDYLSPLLFWLVIAVLPNALLPSRNLASAFLSDPNLAKANLDVRAGIVALSIVGTPILFTILQQAARHGPFTKSALEPIFHAQCLCNAPAQLGILISNYFYYLDPAAMLVMAVLPRLWFLLAEAWVYKEDVQTHWVRSYLLVVLCVLVLSIPAIALQFAE